MRENDQRMPSDVDPPAIEEEIECPVCDGAGYLLVDDEPEQICWRCGGTGRTLKHQLA